MKELEQKNNDPVEIVKQTKQQKQHNLVNSLHPHSGHTCFEYNTVTNVLRKAKYTEQAIDFMAAQKGEIAHKRKVVMNEDCIYITTLNFKNAIKHLSNRLERQIEPIIEK